MPNVSQAACAAGAVADQSFQRLDPRNMLSTTLYSSEYSIDYATRVAKILACRMNVPIYVGCSIKAPNLVADEEMESLAALTSLVMDQWNQLVRS